MAQKPPIGPNAGPVADEAVAVRVELDLREFSQRLQSEAARLLADYSQQGLTGNALADAIEKDLRGTLDVSADRAGSEATHEAFSLGRNVAAQAATSQIQSVVRSAILDTNTCDPCISLDGTMVEMNSPAYFRNMPPNQCDGGEQCRCIYIYGAA